ncbi:MAG: hypothetical protein ACKVS8_04450 [Phycisphaerales bacterium]
MPHDRGSRPHIVSAGRAIGLERIALDDRALSETWYQRLLYEHPALIPVDELEPVFAPLIPLARELQTGNGPVDIAFINPDGYVTLVETKLWNNPDARRSVVAQIIEYASGLSKLTYADLCEKVRRARRGESDAATTSETTEAGGDPILPLVRGQPGFNEARFIDTVTTNLRRGRFLLLIAGNGIREGVEDLAEVMQKSPLLGFTLALVETAVYKMGDGHDSVLVQPRVLLRTREIVRHVIEVRNDHPTATVNVTVPDVCDGDGMPVRRSITEAAYFEQLAEEAGQEIADFARWVQVKVVETPGMSLTWSKTGMSVWWEDESGAHSVRMIRLRPSGEFSATSDISRFCVTEALPAVLPNNYQIRLAALAGNAQQAAQGVKGYTGVKALDGGWPKFAGLAAKRDEFWALLTETTQALAEALASRADDAKR